MKLLTRSRAVQFPWSSLVRYRGAKAHPCALGRGFGISASKFAAKRRRSPTSFAGKKAVRESEGFTYHPALHGAIHRLGFHSDGIAIVRHISYAFEGQIIRNQGPKDALDWFATLEPVERASKEWIHDIILLQDRAVVSELCYLIGHFFWNFSEQVQQNQVEVARLLLLVALEAGFQKAHLDLWLLAKLQGVDPPQKSQRVIQEAAEKQLDWRAMQLYIDDLLRKPNSSSEDRALAFKLAIDLNNLLEPGDERDSSLNNEQLHSLNPNSRPALYSRPWALLKDAAMAYVRDHPKGSEEYQRGEKALEVALRDGAEKYGSVDAMKDWANHPNVKEYSEQWASLKTKAAMAGDVGSCKDLARYWLEKAGWYPCTGKGRLDKEGYAALGWWVLGASMCFDNAEKMATRYLIAALVLRENGFNDEGLTWLCYGIESMEQSCRDVNGMKKHMQKLEWAKKNWTSEPFQIKAAQLFSQPEPILPEEFRP